MSIWLLDPGSLERTASRTSSLIALLRQLEQLMRDLADACHMAEVAVDKRREPASLQRADPRARPIMAPFDPVHRRSLYVDLLNAAITARNESDREPDLEEESAELQRCRRQMVSDIPPIRDRGWSTGAIAVQVAYDVALVRYARCLEIDCDPDRFGWPADERQRLERVAGISCTSPTSAR